MLRLFGFPLLWLAGRHVNGMGWHPALVAFFIAIVLSLNACMWGYATAGAFKLIRTVVSRQRIPSGRRSI
jgi:hypothetical protein